MERYVLYTALLSLIAVTVVVGECPSGWHGHADKCFYLGRHNETFAGAHELCRMLGDMNKRVGYIATVLDAETNKFLVGLMRQSPVDSFFISINDLQNKGVWQLGDTGRNATYFNWGPGQPNDENGKEDCVAITERFGFDYEFVDVPCYTPFGFACEMSSHGQVPVSGSLVG